MSGTPETITFNGTVPTNAYGGYLAAGYDGFNWGDLFAVGRDYVGDDLSGTGYQSAIHGEATGYSGYGGYAIAYSGNLSESFSLKSAVMASAWESDQPVRVESFTYSNGYFHKKAAVLIYLGQTATTVDFRNFGKDFQHIAAFYLTVYPGNAGAQGRYGYQIAMDNVKVAFDGPIPVAHGGHAPRLPLHHAMAHHHAAAAALTDFATHRATAHGPPGDLHGVAYHGELMAWGHHDGGLTAQFSLPSADHPLC